MVIVGSNAVGKTVLLHELYQGAIAWAPAHGHGKWVDRVDMTSSDPVSDGKQLIESLEQLGSAQSPQYRSSAVKTMLMTPQDQGFGQAEYQTLKHNVDTKSDELASILAGNVRYRLPFVALETVDSRLLVPSVAPLQAIHEAPQDPLNVLTRDPVRLTQLTDRIFERFGMRLVLLSHAQTQLELGTAKAALPSELHSEARPAQKFRLTEAWKASNWTRMEESGHGIRAMTRLLLTILEKTNHVVLVDEPELHLHPSQKRILGRTLVEAAQQEGRQLIIVTHDATLLQGVLDSGRSVDILRVASDGDERTIRQFRTNAEAHEGSGVTQREFLNALFYSRVVLVEGAADRHFYQAVIEMFHLDAGREVGFAAGSGIGGIMNVAALCKAVGVPFSVVVDFDALFKNKSVVLTKLTQLCGGKVPEGLAPALAALIAAIESASEGSNPEKILKRSGLRAPGLPTALVAEISGYLDSLNSVGVHVVPRGALGSWCPSVDDSSRFADLALERFRVDETLGQPAATFLKTLLNGIKAR